MMVKPRLTEHKSLYFKVRIGLQQRIAELEPVSELFKVSQLSVLLLWLFLDMKYGTTFLTQPLCSTRGSLQMVS